MKTRTVAEGEIQRVKRTGGGTGAFHPRVLLDLSDETCQKVADFLFVVEVIGTCPTVASRVVFFLLPKLVDSGHADTTVGMGQSRIDGGLEERESDSMGSASERSRMSRIQSGKRCWSWTV